ncbi:MAG: hypothetical protein ACYC7E_07185 [Armatimonadota bacterium]
MKQRWRWVVGIILVAVVGVLVIGPSRQQVRALNTRAVVQQASDWATITPLRDDQLVLLDMRDYGYSTTVELKAEELAYDGYFVDKGVLYRSHDTYNRLPLVIRSGTKAAINLEQSTTECHSTKHPCLVDGMPWTYTSIGVPLWNSNGPIPKAYPWLRHPLTITGIANDGTVTLEAGGRQVLLRPGGKVEIALKRGKMWSSTITISHGGLFAKKKIQQSKWLRVEQ